MAVTSQSTAAMNQWRGRLPPCRPCRLSSASFRLDAMGRMRMLGLDLVCAPADWTPRAATNKATRHGVPSRHATTSAWPPISCFISTRMDSCYIKCQDCGGTS